jgi:hypothetical protein
VRVCLIRKLAAGKTGTQRCRCSNHSKAATCGAADLAHGCSISSQLYHALPVITNQLVRLPAPMIHIAHTPQSALMHP